MEDENTRVEKNDNEDQSMRDKLKAKELGGKQEKRPCYKIPYVESLSTSDIEKLKNKVIVGIDPGKRNLIFTAVDSSNWKNNSKFEKRKSKHKKIAGKRRKKKKVKKKSRQQLIDEMKNQKRQLIDEMKNKKRFNSHYRRLKRQLERLERREQNQSNIDEGASTKNKCKRKRNLLIQSISRHLTRLSSRRGLKNTSKDS